MTTHRDPDALLAAYLADGMEVLPDRVVDAVLDEVHRTRQRTVLGLWRIPPMFKPVLGAAAVIAVLVLGGAAWLGAFRPNESVSAPSPLPSSTATASPSPTASGSPALRIFPVAQQTMRPGPYDVKVFSQPMTLTIPDVAVELGDGAEVTGFIYAGGAHTLQIGFLPADVAITIHDDFRINSDLCRPTAEVQEVPETPAAVGEWLHAQTGLEVTDQPDITVDGRQAKVYDVVTDQTCGSDDPPGDPDVWWAALQDHRIYAVPTGTDTILVMTWNLPNDLDLARLNAIADRLVQSLTFD